MHNRKDDFALLFEQSEYYTIQEACDYLNTKHGTYAVKPSKLLKQMDTHQIPCFFYISDVAIKGNPYRIKLANDDKFYSISELPAPHKKTPPNELERGFFSTGKHVVTNRLNIRSIDEYPLDMALHDIMTQIIASDVVFGGAFLGGKHIAHYVHKYGYFDTINMMMDIVAIDKIIDYNNDVKLHFVDEDIRQILINKYGLDDFGIIFGLAKSDSEKADYQKSAPLLEFLRLLHDKAPAYRIYEKDLFVFHKDLLELESRIIHATPATPKEKLKTDADKLFDIALIYCDKVSRGEITHKNQNHFKNFIEKNNHENLPLSNTIYNGLWVRIGEHLDQAKSNAKKIKK